MQIPFLAWGATCGAIHLGLSNAVASPPSGSNAFLETGGFPLDNSARSDNHPNNHKGSGMVFERGSTRGVGAGGMECPGARTRHEPQNARNNQPERLEGAEVAGNCEPWIGVLREQRARSRATGSVAPRPNGGAAGLPGANSGDRAHATAARHAATRRPAAGSTSASRAGTAGRASGSGTAKPSGASGDADSARRNRDSHARGRVHLQRSQCDRR